MSSRGRNSNWDNYQDSNTDSSPEENLEVNSQVTRIRGLLLTDERVSTSALAFRRANRIAKFAAAEESSQERCFDSNHFQETPSFLYPNTNSSHPDENFELYSQVGAQSTPEDESSTSWNKKKSELSELLSSAKIRSTTFHVASKKSFRK